MTQLILAITLIICMILQFLKEGLFLHGTYLYKIQKILICVFDWLYFIHCPTSFSSINHHLRFFCTFFLSQFFFTQTANFLALFPSHDSHSPAVLDLFLPSNPSICCTIVFPPLGNFDQVVVSVSIDFPSNSEGIAPFHRAAYAYSRADWDGLCVNLRDVPQNVIVKLDTSAAATEFSE